MIPLRQDRSILFALDILEGSDISLGLAMGMSQASLGRRSGQRPMGGGGGRPGVRGGRSRRRYGRLYARQRNGKIRRRPIGDATS